MLDLQIPLLAAKALFLLLLFAFIYVVMRRGIVDLRSIPDDGYPAEPPRRAAYDGYADQQSGYAELVVEDSEVLAPSTRFQLKGESTSIGRSSSSDIVLKSDDYASGRHAVLTKAGGLLYVEDADSTNGTFVNGRRAVGATPLRDGDALRVGSTTFRYSD